MKRKIHLGKLEKLVILVMVVTLAVSILPQLDYAQLFAEDPAAVTLELKEGNITRPLAVTTTDAKAVEAILLKDGAEIERKILNTNTPAQFDIVQNGTYVIQSIDVQGALLEEHEQTVEGLVDIYVETAEQGGLTLYSRMENTDHIAVTFKEKKETVKVEKQTNGLYHGSYTPKENGSYVFQSETVDNTSLGTTATYEETGIAEQPKEEPKKEEPQEVKEIHITNEQGLKDIAKAPDKTYILDSDITVTADSILVEKEFTGTLEGNGHVIKGLKQPLFTSLKKANIKDVNLSSTIDTDADTAALAVRATDTKINGVGILAVIHSKQNAAGMLVNSTNTGIENSYVSGEITGEAGASGFVVSGNTEISNSYMTGIVEGKQSAYGFGKDADITNSYAAVYVEGKETGNFNGEGKKLENCFYDISVASKEEPRAQEYTSAQMVSGNLAIKDFQQTAGRYPSLKKEITDRYSEEAKKLNALSTLAVSTETSLLGIEKDVALPTKTQQEEVTWKAEGNIGINGNTLLAKVSADPTKNTSGTLRAVTESGTRSLKAASAKLLENSPVVGESLAEAKTQISFNMKERLYYKVTETAAEKPESHKQAIESGWKRYLWNDVINWSDLDWYTDYILNEYDMKTDTMKTYPIKTKKGLVGGRVTLSETYKVGAEISATLTNAQCEKGSWTWEKSKSLSSGWETLEADIDKDKTKSTYTPTTEDSGYFIRATFTVSDDQKYQGSKAKISATVIKEALTSINIYTDSACTKLATASDMVVGNQLYAKLEQDKFEADVTYSWHHKTKDDKDQDDKREGNESSYLITGKDVGEKIYVKATAKNDGGASGTTKAYIDTAVKKAATEKPKVKPEIVSIEDISLTVKMPSSVTKGLYQFGYIEQGVHDEPQPFDILARGNNSVTITGLNPNKIYYIYVKQIGEDGYEDSVWSDQYVEGKTDYPYVVGTVEITASNATTAYGQTLSADVKNGSPTQRGEWNWYRIDAEGKRSSSLSTDSYYEILDTRDIGGRIEAVYSGDSTKFYAGEISAQSEVVKKAEVPAPKKAMAANMVSATDSTITFTLPSLDSGGALGVNEKFIVGYSLSENGVPIEYRENDVVMEYKPNVEVTLKNLNRNTTYYLFLRYAEQDEHYKSDWSATDRRVIKKTEKTEFAGNLSFVYANAGATNPIQGEKLIACLDGVNTKEGNWRWTKIVNGEESNITNFFPEDDGATYYMIPATEPVGTTYKVSFTPTEGFSGERTVESAAVQQYVREQYDAPTIAPQSVKQTDTTLTFQMGEDADADVVYEFQYGKENSEDEATNKLVDTKAYKRTDVTITGLDRNTSYYIWVRRAKDDNYEASSWCLSNLKMSTEKTSILGYVSIEGSDTAGKELKATYNKANYIPEGDDTNGTWAWYREDNGSYIQITTGIASNKTVSTYTPTGADIGKKLKAVYTGTGDFKEAKDASTTSIKKNVAVDPQITSLTKGSDVDSHLSMNVSLDGIENVWYRIQKQTELAPDAPSGTVDSVMTKAGWTKAPSASFQITQDYEKKYFEPNISYSVFIVKRETTDTQVSNVISKSIDLGVIDQSGTITFSGNEVVGKTITASLKNANNNRGTWKWYKSTTDCGPTGTTAAPGVNETTKWEQLSSGYSPSIDSDSSTLTISEDMWKYYVKAEFVPNNDLGYGGSSIQTVNSSYIRKIYNEQITITSSTKDGNGKDTAYYGTKVTATVENWIGDDLSSRFEMYVDESKPTAHGKKNRTYSNNTMTATVDYNYQPWDGRNIFAMLTVPENIMLYVDEKLNVIDAGTEYKSDRVLYRAGASISNSTELKSFIEGTGEYSDRAGSYIITQNISLTGVTTTPCATFSGHLDGDYHTITGLSSELLGTVQGSGSTKAVVENIIIKKANIVYKPAVLDGNIGVVCHEVYQPAVVRRILVVDATFNTNARTGMLVGQLGLEEYGSKYKPQLSQGADIYDAEISECSTASGVLNNETVNTSTGGFIGFAPTGRVLNNSSVSTEVIGGNWIGGFIGYASRTSKSYLINNYSAAKLKGGNYKNPAIGGAIGGYGSNNFTNNVMKNTFYDSTITSGTNLSSLNYGTPKASSELVGSELKASFDTYDKSNIWTYKEGYYPILTWLKNSNLSLLYSSTRGSFTSIDKQTNSSDMFSGNLSGSIEIPVDLQGNDFTYSSSNSNILKVTEGGTIIPVGTAGQKATITITYTEPDATIGGSASNSYEFTVKKQVKALSSVSVSGTANPGQKLNATASGATSYQWYRRKHGDTAREKIAGATGAAYTIQPKDVGYEINVDVSASNYATMSSKYSSVVTSVKPTGITTTEMTDQGVTVKADGIDGADYEYAYATTAAGNKIIAGHSTSAFKISGLQRNKQYFLFARVAGAADSSYAPSEWSNAVEITTNKTDIVGPIKLNGTINAGTQLIASIADTNLQKGDWKIERLTGKDSKTLSTDSSTDYGLFYTLTDDDAGSVIRITYTAKAGTDFQKSVSVDTDTILKRSQEAPSKAPEEITASKKDHSIEVQETKEETGTTYEFGYRKSADEDIKLVSGGGVAANTPVTLSSLERNTTYYVYVRKAGKDLYEPSPWSPAVQMTTDRSSVKNNNVTVSGSEKVNQTLTFTVDYKDDNTKDQSGMWVLERVGKDSSNTLVPTTISADTQTITYQLVPEDSGYQINARFIGTQDYKDSCEGKSGLIQNDAQYIGDVIPTIQSAGEYNINAIINKVSDDVYEFGYKEEGDSSITPHPVTAAWGKEVAITPLIRETSYTIYVRKAAKTGYDASEWSKGVQSNTQASTLTGNITYTGTTGVQDTLHVTYEKGKYPYIGDDSGGSWQWKLDDVDVPADKGGQSDSLTIEPIDGNPKVTVTYTAKEKSGFQGEITRDFGSVYKKDAEVPAAPTVAAEAEDNTKEGSLLHLESTDVEESVYYYLRLSSNDSLPKLIAEKDVEDNGAVKDSTENVERWLKAEASMDIRVPANKTYVVYAARLETRSRMASGINSTRGKLSAKEPLLREPETEGQITESDTRVVWKTLQEKTLQYSLYGKAPTATWKYYVTKTPEIATTWQNIDAELKALGRVDEIKDDVSYSTFKVPLKYTGFYLKAVLIGVDDYSGQVEYVSPQALEGKLLTSPSTITHSDTYALLDVLKAEYMLSEGDDDPSGTFYWYRRKDGASDPELVKKDAPGTTSSYQTKEEDYLSYIYAVYVAAPSGQFSGESITDSVYIDHKAKQKTPDAPKILQVNGNSIQFKAPSNYDPSGMDKIPQVVVGYQKVDADGTPIDAAITWQKEADYGDNWFRKLERRSRYKLYAKFLGTSVYAPSDISEASEIVTTENELFDESSLTVQALSTFGTTDSDVGNKVMMSFRGDGYDEGHFCIRRSNGEKIIENVEGAQISENTISYTYTYTADDIGSYIIVDYIANEDSRRFEGTISASNKLVITKPENPDTPDKPELLRDLDTNLYVVVNDTYEYCLNKEGTAPTAESGDWDTLDKGEDGRHQFTNLDRTTTYYLHARIAETKEHRASTAVTSDGESPAPYIDFKTTDVKNTKDKEAAMALSEAITFPATLKKGTITILETDFLKEKDDTGDLNQRSVDVFADSDGKATDAVYERGSGWGNKNFATELILYDGDGSIVDRTDGTKLTLDATKAETMRLAVYRVNAVSDPGPYIWQMTLQDSSEEKITALLKGNVIMTTQLEALVPQQIRMHADGSLIRQSTNNASLRNDTAMPITIGVDRLAQKGTDMPSLMGVMKGGIATIRREEAYLKMSNDGSNFTSPKNGAWFETGTVSKKEDLFLLGRGARADYYVSGAANAGQEWPWDSDEEIKEAYKIRFITSISEEDVSTYERKQYEIREE